MVKQQQAYFFYTLKIKVNSFSEISGYTNIIIHTKIYENFVPNAVWKPTYETNELPDGNSLESWTDRFKKQCTLSGVFVTLRQDKPEPTLHSGVS